MIITTGQTELNKPINSCLMSNLTYIHLTRMISFDNKERLGESRQWSLWWRGYCTGCQWAASRCVESRDWPRRSQFRAHSTVPGAASSCVCCPQRESLHTLFREDTKLPAVSLSKCSRVELCGDFIKTKHQTMC